MRVRIAGSWRLVVARFAGGYLAGWVLDQVMTVALAEGRKQGRHNAYQEGVTAKGAELLAAALAPAPSCAGWGALGDPGDRCYIGESFASSSTPAAPCNALSGCPFERPGPGNDGDLFAPRGPANGER